MMIIKKRISLKKQLHENKNLLFQSKMSYSSKLKILKQMENHINIQVLCLTKEFNHKSSETYTDAWKKNLLTFNPKLSELSI